MTNPLQFLRKARLQHLIMIALVVLLPVTAAFALYNERMDAQLKTAKQERDQVLGQALAKIYSRLGDLRHTIRIIAQDRQLTKALRSSPIDRQSAEEVFSYFNYAIEDLLQVRWIDRWGQERASVEIINHQAVSTPANDLQDRSQDYFFKEGITTPADRVYFSPIDLYVSHGEIEKPYTPTIRIGLHTGVNDGLRPGLLLMNYQLRPLFKRLTDLGNNQVSISLVNNKGYWLLDKNPDLLWGDLLNQLHNTLSETSPQLWQTLKQKHSVSEFIGPSGIISIQPLKLETDEDGVDGYLLATTPAHLLTEFKTNALVRALSIGFILFVVGVLILWRELQQQQRREQLVTQLEEDKIALQQASEKREQMLQEQQLLQDDLLEARKLSSLGMMVAGVAHELNTPIGGALLTVNRQTQDLNKLQQSFTSGLSKQALMDYLNNTEQGLSLLHGNLERCARLVKSFKRMAIDRANEDLVAFSPHQIASDLITSVNPQLKKYKITVENQIPTDIRMNSFPGILSQVFQNLFSNALDHAFKPTDNGTIWLKGDQTGPYFTLVYEDDGCGIDRSILPNLFDPFVTSTRGKGNTGLGTHFIHQWVTQVLKGKIEVESPIDHKGGTRFIIRLPLVIKELDV